ncbi:HipA domain-containing protein, partial [Pseudomonas viridiflava]|uniref:HipA domain-containing protein n=1 Tax=Pseudomonas viridiflava TaxID=33069 RepID=UPI0013DF1DE8
RNSDCHAKNIALLYTSRADVVFTPVYDLVTTQAYPRFASNPPGLSIGGRKTWTPGRSVETFFKAVIGISPRQYAAMVEQLCESAIAVGKEVIEASKNEPAWRNVAKHMVHAWNEGMETLRSPKAAPHFRGLDTLVEEAGLSGPS